MGTVEVSLKDEVLFVGESIDAPSGWMFWNRIVFEGSTEDRDKLVEKLQESNATWEGYLNTEGKYVLHLPPIFKVTRVETLI